MMKWKGKKIVLALLLLCIACGALFAAACAAVPPDEKPEGDYSFENTEEPEAETDADVSLDGNFDESFYSPDRTHWYDYALEMTPGHTIRVRMAMHFGERGTYFAVDVDDAQVNFNEAIKLSYNSSVELMMAAGHETSAVGKAYRYRFSAGGQTKWDIYSLNDYVEWDSPYGFAPRSAIALKGGEIGAGCTGYKAEIFIPNQAIELETTPENMSVFLCVNASYSSEAGAQLREWKGFNIEQTTGEGWDRPDTWFQFDNTGLVADDVTVSAGEGGSVVLDYDYTLKGMKSGLTITPDEGYRVSSFEQEGKEVSGKLQTENGVSRYEFMGAGRDIEFSVEFEKVSENLYTVEGAISANSFENAPTGEELRAAIESVTLETVTETYTAAMDGLNYSVTAPAGSYKLKVYTAQYTLMSEQITLGQDIEKDIVLDENAWLGRYFVDLNAVAVTENLAYDSLMNEWVDAKTFTYGGRIAVVYDEGTIVPEVRFQYDEDRYLRVQLMRWGDVYCVKLIVSGCNDLTFNLTGDKKAFADRLRENGGYIICAVDAENGTLCVYLDNGSGFAKVAEQTAAWLSGATLQDVQVCKADDALGRTVSFENGVLYTNCADAEIFAENCRAQYTLDDEEVCHGTEVTVRADKVGQQAAVTVTAEPGVLVIVTVNGEEIAGEGNEFSFTAYYYNDVKVTAYAPADFTATVEVPADMEAIDRVEARPVNGGAAVELTYSSENGKFSAPLAGAYEIWVISESGFGRMAGETDVRGEAVSETYSLTADDWTDGILEPGGSLTTGMSSMASVWEADEVEIRTGTLAAALTVEIDAWPENGSVEIGTRLFFNNSSNTFLRLDFNYSSNGTMYIGITNKSHDWISLNNLQNKYPAAFRFMMTEKKIHLIISVDGTNWAFYLWNGFAYQQITDTYTGSDVNSRFTNISWLEGAKLTAVQAKKNTDAYTVIASDCKIATGSENVAKLLDSVPAATAELTVTVQKEVAGYPDVAKLTVKVGDTERELTGGKITLSCGTYEIWAYYADGKGRKLGDVTMRGEAQTKQLILTAENWGTLQGKEIWDANTASSDSQLTLSPFRQDSGLSNFELVLDYEINKWDGNTIGDPTTLESDTFTAIILVDFGTGQSGAQAALGQHLRVNVYKATQDWGALQVKLNKVSGAPAQMQTEITGAQIAAMNSATGFRVRIVVQNAKATVSITFNDVAQTTVTVSNYDLSALGEDALLNFVGVRRMDGGSDMILITNSSIKALPAE